MTNVASRASTAAAAAPLSMTITLSVSRAAFLVNYQ